MKYTLTHTVSEKETAIVVGSGSLPVYATPAMIALMENSATKTIENLHKGFTTVGIEINAKHLKASCVGDKLYCTVIQTANNGKIYDFEIEVRNEKQELIGSATHRRALVTIESFMAKLK